MASNAIEFDGDPAVLLRRHVEAAHRVVVFTGAGLSTESGIPDFRSPGGYWTRNMPIYFDDFIKSEEMRIEAWRRKFAMEEHFAGARPSRGHEAIAHLVEIGKVTHVITQNIDNLHQVSGVPDARIIELHGNGSYAVCLDCGRRHEHDWVRAAFDSSGRPPDCPACGGLVKSATISFGQAMPEREMRLAEGATAGCDLFISIGSSLVVYPAAGFPVLAKRGGAKLIIVNREETDLDDIADLVLHEDIGTVMEPLMSVGAVSVGAAGE